MTKYLFAFIIPIFLLSLMAFFKGWFDINGTSILESDVSRQYINFLSYYKSVFESNNNLFYSLNYGMGGELYGLSAYYLFSPFNLIVLLFSYEFLPYTFVIIVFLKIGFMGLSMNIMLNKLFGESLYSIIFSTSYAFCAYVTIYYYNVMWLDGLILLPLITLGIHKLILDNKNSYLYIVTLFFAIVTNYYIGWMICIFITIYSFYLLFVNYNRFSDWFKRIKLFLLDSLLAVAAASIVLIPVLYVMMNSNKVLELPELKFVSNFNVIDYLKQFFFYADFNKNDGLPNIFCGSIAVCVFFLSCFGIKKHKIKEGFASICVILILMFSSMIEYTNLIWHGFNYNIGYPFRYSFVVSFFVLLTAYKFFIYYNINFMTKKNWRVIVLLLLVFQISETTLFIYKHLDGGICSVDQYAKESNEINVNQFELKEGLYRIEKNFMRTQNDSLQMRYNGLSYSSSTASRNSADFLRKMGIYVADLGISANYHRGVTSFVDSFLGVRYLVSKDVQQYKPYRLIDKNKDITIYENENALPLVFGYSSSSHSNIFDENERNTFVLQNMLANYITGKSIDIYQEIQDSEFEMKNIDIEKRENGVKYYVQDDNEEAYILYKINVINTNPIYVNFSGKENTNIELWVNDLQMNDFQIKPYNCYNIGTFPVKSEVTIKLKINESVRIEETTFYYEDYEALNTFYNTVSLYGADLSKISSSHYKGNIEVNSNFNKILFTIPYDKGWSVKIDGVKVNVNVEMQNLMSVNVIPGNHKIEMLYVPKGFWIGVLVSIFSIITIVSMFLKSRVASR